MSPQDYDHALALAARDFRWRVKKFDELLADPEEAFAWAHQCKPFRQALLAMGRTREPRVYNCIREMAGFLTRTGDPLPRWLQEYVVDALYPPRKKRGRSAATNQLRDVAIVHTVALITWIFELEVMRNAGTRYEKHCGCSIVSEALGLCGFDRMKEPNVARIWTTSRWARLNSACPNTDLAWLVGVPPV